MTPQLVRAKRLLATALIACAACGTRGDSTLLESEQTKRAAPATARAHYLANAGVLVERGETKVVLGDADANDQHFALDAEYWSRRDADIAFPPYWFFQSDEGRRVVEQRLRPAHTVGVHVPARMPRRPEDRPEFLQNDDLFLEPGETRDISP